MSEPELEEARLLLRKASEDLEVVRKLEPDAQIADSAVGFHAQQSAEKALKAVLSAAGKEFPWTHDLRHLIDCLSDAGMAVPESLLEVPWLAPWAVEFRYGGTIDEPLDRKRALLLATEAVAWARSTLEHS